MPIQHTKEYGIYHWDTFDNETFLVGETDSLKEAEEKIKKEFRVAANGADVVEVVNQQGKVVKKFNIC